MKEQMHEILMNLNRMRIAVSDAETQLLDLFSVNSRCSVCGSNDGVKWLDITDCCLCTKCQDDLSKGFDAAMMSRSEFDEDY